ncbi:MAG: universal stress protein [Actinomadura sp.]
MVVGFDGSAHAIQALDWALDEAELRDLPLTLCHVWQWPYSRPDETGRTSLRIAANHVLEHGVECARNRTRGVRVASMLCEGPPAERLVEMSGNADLLVVGSRGLGGIARVIVGSVAGQVAAHAECPVIVIRGAGPLPRRESPRPLVVGVDYSSAAEAALGFGLGEARLRELPLQVIHASGEPDLVGVDMADAAERLEKIVAPWSDRYPDVELRLRVIDKQPRAALRDAAEEAGLVVVGAVAHRRVPLGSVSHWLLHHLSCPVTVVPDALIPDKD